MLVGVTDELPVRPDARASEAKRLEGVMRLVAVGDQSAFADLYDATSPRLLGLVKRLLIDHAQSEEVLQEVYLEIWQQAPRFSAVKGSVMSWMLTIAHRRAVDRIRASQASTDRDIRIGIRDLAPEFDSVAESAEISLERGRVAAALQGLSVVQREAVELTYFGGLTNSEVAERQGVPLGTVKTRLRDGLIRLREGMGVSE
jgi:RNA polymerase sigma-70 factor (ECF subfamily)